MKIKIIFALVATTALCGIVYFVLCNGLSDPHIPKKKVATIVGSWKMDTVYNKKDSTSLNLLVYALADYGTIFKFNADSTLQTTSPKKTETNYYVFSNDSLIVKQDSSLDTSLVKFENDSLISITNKDSTILVLRRLTSK